MLLLLSHWSRALAQQDSVERARAAEIVRAFPCRPVRFTIGPVLPGGSSPIDCSLALAAVHEIARGRARRLGVQSADTARIVKASVMSNHFRGLDGAPDDVYWLVSLRIRGRRLPIEFHIDQRSDSIAVWNGEGRDQPRAVRQL